MGDVAVTVVQAVGPADQRMVHAHNPEEIRRRSGEGRIRLLFFLGQFANGAWLAGPMPVTIVLVIDVKVHLRGVENRVVAGFEFPPAGGLARR